MTTPGANQLIAEVDVFPDHGMVIIEDGGRSVTPEPGPGWGLPGTVAASDHTIQVVTMTADTADDLGRDVAVRVYRGRDTAGLGELVFDGTLVLTEPALAIGELLVGKEHLHQVPLDHTGPIHLQIYTQNTIPEVPASDPTDINVLIQ